MEGAGEGSRGGSGSVMLGSMVAHRSCEPTSPDRTVSCAEGTPDRRLPSPDRCRCQTRVSNETIMAIRSDNAGARSGRMAHAHSSETCAYARRSVTASVLPGASGTADRPTQRPPDNVDDLVDVLVSLAAFGGGAHATLDMVLEHEDRQCVDRGS
jgi:hypothetical protein